MSMLPTSPRGGVNWAAIAQILGGGLAAAGQPGGFRNFSQGAALGAQGYEAAQDAQLQRQYREQQLQLQQEEAEARRTAASDKARLDQQYIDFLNGATGVSTASGTQPPRFPGDPRGAAMPQQTAQAGGPFANLPPEKRALLAMAGREAGLPLLAEWMQPEQFKPDLESFNRDGRSYSGYFGPDGQWVDMGSSPQWAPQQPQQQPERVRLALAAGLQPGTPEYQQFLLGKDDTPPGPFQGTGLDAQSYNLVLGGDPSTPEYAAAYSNLAQPKVSLDPVTQKYVIVQPDMSWARKPGGTAAGAPASTPQTPSQTVTQVPGATITSDPGAPVFNEGQGKAAGFADRMKSANATFDDANAIAAGQDPVQGVKSGVPLIGNYLTSADRQRFEQAERNFINAQLRRESGAVISQEEFANARAQYIPQPGDTPEVLAQKKINRQQVVDAMAREGGPFYNGGGGGNDPLKIR